MTPPSAPAPARPGDGGRPLRILQTVASTDRRGAEIFGVELGAALSARGHHVQTWALAPGTREPRLDVPTLGPRSLSTGTVRALRRRARHADVVIGHGSRTLPLNAAATTGLDVPVVYRSIGEPAYWTSSWHQRLRTGALMRRATVIVVVWGGAAASIGELYGVAAARLRVIPRGVPTDRFRPATRDERDAARDALGIDGEAPVYAYLGALSPEKNVGAALDAIARLGDARLLVAGDGPLAGELRTRAEALGVADRVHFLGETDRPEQVLAATDVLVLPSFTEGTPGVLIEAGLCGIPAVASDVGGVSGILMDGRTGLLVGDPEDVDGLAAAMREAFGRADALGAAATQRCRSQFAIDEVARRWERLVLELAHA